MNRWDSHRFTQTCVPHHYIRLIGLSDSCNSCTACSVACIIWPHYTKTNSIPCLCSSKFFLVQNCSIHAIVGVLTFTVLPKEISLFFNELGIVLLHVNMQQNHRQMIKNVRFVDSEAILKRKVISNWLFVCDIKL